MDIAYGMSATFLFDMVMIVVFPILGRAMGLSDAAFGLWGRDGGERHVERCRDGYAFARRRAILRRW